MDYEFDPVESFETKYYAPPKWDICNPQVSARKFAQFLDELYAARLAIREAEKYVQEARGGDETAVMLCNQARAEDSAIGFQDPHIARVSGKPSRKPFNIWIASRWTREDVERAATKRKPPAEKRRIHRRTMSKQSSHDALPGPPPRPESPITITRCVGASIALLVLKTAH